MNESTNNKNILISYITENNSDIITNDEMKTITYIDNISRIMIYYGNSITMEYFINNKEVDDNTISRIKEKLEKYRIYFNKYITNKDIESLAENTLNKLKYTSACFINNDEIILNLSDYGLYDNITLISNDGNYTNSSMIITYLEKKREEEFDKIYISFNRQNIDSILKTLDLINPQINTEKLELKLDLNTKESNESISEHTSDINEFRYTMTNNNQITWHNLNNTYLEITNIINKNKELLDEIDNNTIQHNEHTYNILNSINKFQNIIKEALTEKKIEIINDYLKELIGHYEQYEIDKNKITTEQVSLLNKLRNVINKTLDLIGIIPE